MFGGIGLKLMGFALVALFVGGIIFAGYTFVTNMQDEIKILTSNNVELTNQNEILSNEINIQKTIAKGIEKERVSAEESDFEIRKKLNTLRQRITNRDEIERQSDLAKSRRAQLLLNITKTQNERMRKLLNNKNDLFAKFMKNKNDNFARLMKNKEID